MLVAANLHLFQLASPLSPPFCNSLFRTFWKTTQSFPSLPFTCYVCPFFQLKLEVHTHLHTAPGTNNFKTFPNFDKIGKGLCSLRKLSQNSNSPEEAQSK